MKKNTCFKIVSLLFIFCFFYACSAKDIKNPDEARAVSELGEAYFLEGLYSRALGEFLKAEKLDPEDPYIQNNLGLSYLAMQKAELAIKHFERAIKLRESYYPAQNSLATAYIALEDWDSAIEILEPLSEELLYGTPHFALSNLAFVYFNQKQYQKALNYYNRALKHETRHAPALRGKTMTYMALKDYTKALIELEKILENYPRESSSWLLKGEILEADKDYREAHKAYMEALINGRDTEIEEEAQEALRRVSAFIKD